MTGRITKGMILAAGLGTRLRPLTYKIPKPLIEAGGKKIIEYNLELFVKAGIRDIIINIHYLPEQIKRALGDGSKYGVRITYSYEPEILGTGGGIKKCEGFFEGKPFAVINCDVLTDIDLKDVIDFHFKEGAKATLVIHPLDDGEKYTPLRAEGGRLKEIGGGDMMYTGIQIIDPSILKVIPYNAPSDIVKDVYIPLLKSGGDIAAYTHSGFWTEIGSLEKLEAARELLRENKIDL